MIIPVLFSNIAMWLEMPMCILEELGGLIPESYSTTRSSQISSFLKDGILGIMMCKYFSSISYHSKSQIHPMFTTMDGSFARYIHKLIFVVWCRYKLTFVEEQCRGLGSDKSSRVKWEKTLGQGELKYLTSISYIDNEGWLNKLPSY